MQYIYHKNALYSFLLLQGLLLGCNDVESIAQEDQIVEDFNTQFDTSIDALNACVEPMPIDQNSNMVDLIITEVSEHEKIGSPLWVEIYNPTDQEIILSSYAIVFPTTKTDLYSSTQHRVIQYQYETNPSKPTPQDYHHLTSFNKVLQPNEHYVIFDGQQVVLQPPPRTSNDGVAYLPSYSVAPSDHVGYLSSNIAGVELVKQVNGQYETVDFVRFGTTTDQYFAPTTALHWIGTGAPYTKDPETSISYIRTVPYRDTNSAQDWGISKHITIGGSNHYALGADLDNDGIPDSQEDGLDEQGQATQCEYFNNLPLYAMGARAGVADIFVEIDQLNSANIDITKNALTIMQSTIQDYQGLERINIHIDMGSKFSQVFAPSHFNLSDSNTQHSGGENLPFTNSIGLFSLHDRIDYTSTEDARWSYTDIRRLYLFHYQLVGEDLDGYVPGQGGTTGLATLNGLQSIIGLTSLFDSIDQSSIPDEQKQNMKDNTFATTSLHEIGHNLGLQHGGDTDSNNKPNYVSIMNYMYQQQFPQGNQEDGYAYYAKYNNQGCSVHYSSNLLTALNTYLNPPTQFKFSFSYGKNGSINENQINEQDGLKFDNSNSPVDFNCNGTIESNISMDINDDGTQTTLQDFNDWGKIFQQVNTQKYYNIAPTTPAALLDVYGNTPEITIGTIPTKPVPVCPAPRTFSPVFSVLQH